MLYVASHVPNSYLLVPVLSTRVQVLLSVCLRSSNLMVYKNTVTTHTTSDERSHIKCTCNAFNEVCVCVCVLIHCLKFLFYAVFVGAHSGVVVKALRYKPACRTFDS